MFKRIGLALCLFTLPLLNCFAGVQYGDTAFGIVYSSDFAFVSGPLAGLGLSGKIPGLPPVLGLNFWFSRDSSFISVTGDWRLFMQPIFSPIGLNLCLGPGIFTNLALSKEWNLNLGLRVPITLSWYPIKFLEAFFLELAPAVNIALYGGEASSMISPIWSIQGSVGCRFWF